MKRENLKSAIEKSTTEWVFVIPAYEIGGLYDTN
jgi:hypothetical protein